jgi:hypothetical protein
MVEHSELTAFCSTLSPFEVMIYYLLPHIVLIRSQSCFFIIAFGVLLTTLTFEVLSLLLVFTSLDRVQFAFYYFTVIYSNGVRLSS